MLNGCKCKTGCLSRVCGCKKKLKKIVGLAADALAVAMDRPSTPTVMSHTAWMMMVTQMSYTDESDDDTDQFRNDLDLYERVVESIMAHIFGDDDDDYENTL